MAGIERAALLEKFRDIFAVGNTSLVAGAGTGLSAYAKRPEASISSSFITQAVAARLGAAMS